MAMVILVTGYLIYSHSESCKLNSLGEVYLTRVEPSGIGIHEPIILVVFPKDLPDKCVHIVVYRPYHGENDFPDVGRYLEKSDVLTFEPIFSPEYYQHQGRWSVGRDSKDIITGQPINFYDWETNHIGRLKDLSAAINYALKDPNCIEAKSDYYEVLDGKVFEKVGPKSNLIMNNRYINTNTRTPLKEYSLKNLEVRWKYYDAGNYSGKEMDN